MSSVIAPARQLNASPEVLEYAERANLLHYLDPLAEALEQAFPGRPYRFLHQPDPELVDVEWIIMEVDLRGWSREEASAARNTFGQLRSQLRPPLPACVFALWLER
jgi:hypothetical protein